jgi:DNA-binding transcriptional regulator YiaG
MSYVQERLAQLGETRRVTAKPKRNERKRRLYKTDHLTRHDFGLIRELARYLPQREIARKFETTQQHVHRIVNYAVQEPLR